MSLSINFSFTPTVYQYHYKTGLQVYVPTNETNNQNPAIGLYRIQVNADICPEAETINPLDATNDATRSRQTFAVYKQTFLKNRQTISIIFS